MTGTCLNCKWLKLIKLANKENWYGQCICPHNKIRIRLRTVSHQQCRFKELVKKEKA